MNPYNEHKKQEKETKDQSAHKLQKQMQNVISHSPQHFWSLDEGVDLSWDFENRPSNKNAISLLEFSSYRVNTQGFKVKTLERIIDFLQNRNQEIERGSRWSMFIAKEGVWQVVSMWKV